MDVRGFILTSFINIFKIHKTIPVSIVAEPFLRLMQINDQRLKLNVTDFDFFAMLSEHPKLAP